MRFFLFWIKTTFVNLYITKILAFIKSFESKISFIIIFKSILIKKKLIKLRILYLAFYKKDEISKIKFELKILKSFIFYSCYKLVIV